MMRPIHFAIAGGISAGLGWHIADPGLSLVSVVAFGLVMASGVFLTLSVERRDQEASR